MTPVPDPARILPGAEPFAAEGGPEGALVLHGFTGSPHSVRGLAEALAAAGFTVELPLLPGHGTAVDDLARSRWPDWSGAAEEAYQALAARVERVVLVGLSMGGCLATWLAARHPEVAGLVVVNPFIEPPAESYREIVRGLLDTGAVTVPGVGSDIAKPDTKELAYDETPLEAALSLFEGLDETVARLADVTCPVLVMTSPQDHVAPPAGSDRLAEGVSGPVERVTLARSYHVATLDWDADEIEARAVAFARKVTSG